MILQSFVSAHTMASALSQPSAHNRKISLADLAAPSGTTGPMYTPQQPPQHPQHHSQHPQHQQPPPPTAAQQAQAQQASLRATEAARARALEPTDRTLPDDLSEIIVGEGVERYNALRSAERRLDAVMMRKRLDVGDNLQRRFAPREGVLKIWVSNTVEGQAWQVVEEARRAREAEGADEGLFGEGLDFSEGSAATWRVKIEGRLIEDNAGWDSEASTAGKKPTEDPADKSQDPENTTTTTKKPPQRRRPRLSHFFKSITISLPQTSSLPTSNPDAYTAITWTKPQPSTPGFSANSPEASFDTLEFARKGDENLNVTIALVRDEVQERFRLSEPLAELLDCEEEDRAGAVQGVWEYVRARGLMEDEDRRSIICDEGLRRVSPPYLSFSTQPRFEALVRVGPCSKMLIRL